MRSSETGMGCTEDSEVTANGTSTICPVTKKARNSHWRLRENGGRSEPRLEVWLGSLVDLQVDRITKISDVILYK